MPARTKKLINHPDDVIAELIDGMVGAHPDLLRVEGETGRAVVAVDGPRAGKVGIVVGGGSGHEPAFYGYVGRGLADAAAIGNVFASPSPDQIADAARAVDGGAGVLFLYGNYTGDVMNFDMAAELLKGEGIEARSVQVTDDVASAPKARQGERRGIAGDVFVFKIAGAAADRGLSLDEVEAWARRANAATASMGVALGPCSLPQTGVPNFSIGDTEMEVGMGIHGEPGIERTTLETADRVADRLLDPILADLDLRQGTEVAVMINGLGATSLMELYILHRHVRGELDRRDIRIHRSFVGEYATSLEMAGASVTLVRLDAELRDLLDHPCQTLGLKIGAVAHAAAEPSRAPRHATREAEPAEARSRDLIAEGDISPALFRRMMENVARRIAEEKDALSALDGVIGDGDHGVTMDQGWRAILAALGNADETDTVTALSQRAGKAFLGAVGASAGPLYATGFLRAAERVSDRLNLDAGALVLWLEGMAEGIQSRGGAQKGDKTMLDAWLPAVAAARGTLSRAEMSSIAVLQAAAQAAQEGAEATKGLEARRGRAAKLGCRSLGHTDPGARSAAIILAAMAEALR